MNTQNDQKIQEWYTQYKTDFVKEAKAYEVACDIAFFSGAGKHYGWGE